MNEQAQRIADRVANMTPADWVKHNSKSMLMLEAIWLAAAETLDEKAGDDRCGQDAQDAAKAHSMYHQLKAMHREMDIIACRVDAVPILRIGDR